MKQLLIFTDLDGTLLDHNTYSYQPARLVLNQIKQYKIPLIFNSSKTKEEILELQNELGICHPFIVENGAATYVPYHYWEEMFPKSPQWEIHHFGLEYTKLLDIVYHLRQKHGFRFQGFSDFTLEEIVRHTGLEKTQAQKAKRRNGTEPILWMDDKESLNQFHKYLKKNKLELTKGGRFYHIKGAFDKGKACQWLIQKYVQNFPGKNWVSVGLGDSLNDLPMLESVDIPVIIQANQGESLKIKNSSAIYTKNKGPYGWQFAVKQIFQNIYSGM